MTSQNISPQLASRRCGCDLSDESQWPRIEAKLNEARGGKYFEVVTRTNQDSNIHNSIWKSSFYM